MSSPVHLIDRSPQVSGAEMVAALVPPPQFDDATFETYRADPAYPSQQEAKDRLIVFSGGGAPAERGGLFRRAKKAPEMKEPSKDNIEKFIVDKDLPDWLAAYMKRKEDGPAAGPVTRRKAKTEAELAAEADAALAAKAPAKKN